MTKNETGSALFVFRPRRASDLYRPHLLNAEKPFVIAARVCLDFIDYENFTEDMLADRDFLEQYAPLCAGPERRCILVQTHGQSGGVLVVPDGAFVLWAAAFSEQ